MKPTLRAALSTLVIALSTSPAGAAPVAPTALYTVEAIRLDAPGCSKDCTQIELEYPRILKAPNPQALARVNQAIQQALREGLSFEKPKASLQAGIDDFFAEAAKFRQEMPDGPPWQLVMSIEPEAYSERLLSLRVDSYVFAGGAHGSPYSYFLNFDLQTGEILELDKLLVPGARRQLEQVAEERFRSEKEITQGSGLQEAGYDFENNRFALPKVFGFNRNGLIFYYNVYEIGPYAAGPTELQIDFYSLRKLIKPEYLRALDPGVEG